MLSTYAISPILWRFKPQIYPYLLENLNANARGKNANSESLLVKPEPDLTVWPTMNALSFSAHWHYWSVMQRKVTPRSFPFIKSQSCKATITIPETTQLQACHTTSKTNCIILIGSLKIFHDTWTSLTVERHTALK